MFQNDLSNDNDLAASLSLCPVDTNNKDLNNICSQARTRVVPYSLNQANILDKLAVDATKEDLKIEINNSNSNVNICCNSGFYTEIAQQIFSGLTLNFTQLIGDIQIRCIEHSPTLHLRGAFAGNLVVKFLLSQKNHQIDSVAVNMHNTSRNVQVQGSSIMPDGNTAAVQYGFQ